MVLKAQTTSPLETIYEESGSFIASTEYSQPDYRAETTNGLISARAIPTVNIQRQQADDKPPVEVRFRDGSIRYIHPSTTATMIINRRNLLDSSGENLSSNYRPLLRSNFNKRTFQQSKLPLVFTIITADDMRQAGITPSGSSSASGSDISAITPSPSINSPLLSFDSLENSREDALKQSSVTDDQSLSTNNSTSNHYSSTSVLPFSTSSNHSLSTPSLKTSISSLQITLTNDSSIHSKLSDEIVKHAIQSSTAVSAENTNHSAFRPFFKSVQFKSQPVAIKPRVPSTYYQRLINPTQQQQQQQQQQQIVPYSRSYQKSVPSNATSSIIQVSYRPHVAQKNFVAPAYAYDSNISNPIDIEVTMNPSANLQSLLQMNSSSYPKLINYTVDNSFNPPNNSSRTISFTTNPTMKWFNVTSNSIYDIPRLSSKYSSIPLRINVPVLSPTPKQKLTIHHSTALEKRLLNAGLSPETVTLYQRILEVAGYRQKNIFSPTQTIDQYS